MGSGHSERTPNNVLVLFAPQLGRDRLNDSLSIIVEGGGHSGHHRTRLLPVLPFIHLSQLLDDSAGPVDSIAEILDLEPEHAGALGEAGRVGEVPGAVPQEAPGLGARRPTLNAISSPGDVLKLVTRGVTSYPGDAYEVCDSTWIIRGTQCGERGGRSRSR